MNRYPVHSLLALLVLTLALGAGAHGCRNPADSTLPSSALAPAGTPLPPLPKGHKYADEPHASPDTPIEPGDMLEVLIRLGAKEEKHTSVVSEDGIAAVSFLEVDVEGVTAGEAAAYLQEEFEPYMKNPRVQVILKKRAPRVKRVFVFGAVKKPGMLPMPRNMTVLQAIALAENYTESAILDEIRVIRGNLAKPTVLTADVARLLTFGDRSRDLHLEENDIVYVPRTRLGDAQEATAKLAPIITLALQPLYSAFIVDSLIRR